MCYIFNFNYIYRLNLKLSIGQLETGVHIHIYYCYCVISEYICILFNIYLFVSIILRRFYKCAFYLIVNKK